jgi:pectate lyase
MVKTQSDLELAVRSDVMIRFSPNITITLTKIILFSNLSNIAIIGPATLTQFGLYFEHCQNILVQDVRIINASIYGILIFHSQNVVIDHCTILDASRTDVDRGKCIDLTEESVNVTISRCLLGYTFPVEMLIKWKGLLIANFNMGPVTNVSIHHNVFYCDYQRSPEISTPGLFDFRQNLVFNYTEYGSRIRNGAWGNFVQNWYIGGKKDPLVFEEATAQLYATSNTWLEAGKQQMNIPDRITHAIFSVPNVSSHQISQVLNEAGCLVRGRWETLVVLEVKPFIK